MIVRSGMVVAKPYSAAEPVLNLSAAASGTARRTIQGTATEMTQQQGRKSHQLKP
jgi:hypothetical protein